VTALVKKLSLYNFSREKFKELKTKFKIKNKLEKILTFPFASVQSIETDLIKLNSRV
jgi:hypothetical protein